MLLTNRCSQTEKGPSRRTRRPARRMAFNLKWCSIPIRIRLLNSSVNLPSRWQVPIPSIRQNVLAPYCDRPKMTSISVKLAKLIATVFRCNSVCMRWVRCGVHFLHPFDRTGSSLRKRIRRFGIKDRSSVKCLHYAANVRYVLRAPTVLIRLNSSIGSLSSLTLDRHNIELNWNFSVLVSVQLLTKPSVLSTSGCEATAVTLVQQKNLFWRLLRIQSAITQHEQLTRHKLDIPTDIRYETDQITQYDEHRPSWNLTRCLRQHCTTVILRNTLWLWNGIYMAQNGFPQVYTALLSLRMAQHPQIMMRNRE